MGAALACALLGAAASAALAAAGTYTVNITPANVSPSTSTSFNVALKNTSTGGQGLASAAIIVPAGFKISTVTVPSGSGSVDQLPNNTILLGHLSVTPGTTLHVTVTAVTPPRCSGSLKWVTQAAQTDFWSPKLTLQTTSSNLTTNFGGCALQFVTQPNDTVVNQAITGTADDPTGPPVSVEIVNGGTVVNTSTPITMALANNPGGGALSGTLKVNTSAGIAKFKNLKLNKPGTGYTLTASSPSITSVTSSSFDEDQSTTKTCSTSPCQTSLSTSASSLSVSVNQSAGKLTESVDEGTPLSCADTAHGGYTGFDPNWYGLSITGSSDKTLSYLLNATPDNVDVCFGATADFTTDTGGQAAAGTLPDGTSGFIGLLAFCEDDDASSGEPCIDSIDSGPNGNGTLATIDIPQAFAGDPFAHM